MKDYIYVIKGKVTNILENFEFDHDKSLTEQVENKLSEILDEYLDTTDLFDYWVEVKHIEDEKFDIHIGLQEGEHDNAEIYYIDIIIA